MNFEYENQGTTTFLTYTARSNQKLDNVGIGMLSNNSIPGVLPIVITQVDDLLYLRYNVSSKITLQNYLSGMVSQKKLVNTFISICDAYESSEEYMLESELFVRDTNYIFVDVSSGKVSMAYLPLLDYKSEVDLGVFFKQIVFGITYDLSGGNQHIGEIINFINTTPNFSLKEFRAKLYEISVDHAPKEQKPETKPAAHTNTPAVPRQMPNEAQPQQAPAQKETPPAPEVPPQTVKQPLNTGEDTKPKPAAGMDVPPSPAAKEEPKKKNAGPKKSIFGKLFGGSGEKPEKAKEPIPAKSKIPATPSKPVTVPGVHKPVQNPEPERSEAFAQVVPKQPDWSGKQAETVQKNYGGTTVLSQAPLTTVLSGNAAETTLLNQNQPQQPQPMLIRNKNGERTVITSRIFHIGTERSFVDYWVSDNPAVSRSHADIIYENGKYFIQDNGSTNHTYLNGEMISSNQMYPISSGARITLADEEFQFFLE